MTGKDKEKKSSRSGQSSSSSRKKSTSSSSHKKSSSSSSHKNSSPRATRDAHLDTTEEDYEQEYDGPQHSVEGNREGRRELAYAEADDAAGETQRPPATPGYDASYAEAEQVWNQAQQTATGSTGLQSGTTYEDVHTQQNPSQSESASRRVPPMGYPNSPWVAPQTWQTPHPFPESYTQSTDTAQAPRRLGATMQSYTPTPDYQIQRSGTSLGGPTAPASAAATERPRYVASTTPYPPEGQYLGQAPDMRMRPWQDIQPDPQRRPAESWGTAPREERRMDDKVNRVRDEDDNTGS